MHWSVIYLISEWVIRLAMLVYVPRQRNAAASRTWLLLIFLLPLPGMIFYGLVGRIYVPKKRLASHERASRKLTLVLEQMHAREMPRPTLAPEVSHLAHLGMRLGRFEPLAGNSVELLTDYAGSISRLIDDIHAATQQIHLLYYIYEDDATGHRVTEALIAARRRGVKCRVLMDAVASKKALRRLAPRLKESGVEVTALLPGGLFTRNTARYDLRNHRKIAVFDGKIAYTGSQNVNDGEFVPDYPNEELVVRLTGPIVWQLQAVFLADDYSETDLLLPGAEAFPAALAGGDVTAQVIPSGPGYRHENVQEMMINLLYAAREKVVLTTPYFVPDEPFLEAMRSSARRGVTMHLIVSAHANQMLTQLAQRSFYDELLEDGVNIHLYQPRFLHAKCLTIDRDIALIGSANVDIRSFALNAEISVVMYNAEVVSRLQRIHERHFAHSVLLKAADWKRRSPAARIFQGIARLADSFL